PTCFASVNVVLKARGILATCFLDGARWSDAKRPRGEANRHRLTCRPSVAEAGALSADFLDRGPVHVGHSPFQSLAHFRLNDFREFERTAGFVRCIQNES